MLGLQRIRSGIVTPTQLTGNVNNYAPAGITGANILRLSSDASRNITGLSAIANLWRQLIVMNVGAQDIVLVDASASSTEANRFSIGGDLTLAAKRSVILLYDPTQARWTRCS